ncbi:MAG: hypothetical protein ACRDUT_07650 [Mycobacterium sp.]
MSLISLTHTATIAYTASGTIAALQKTRAVYRSWRTPKLAERGLIVAPIVENLNADLEVARGSGIPPWASPWPSRSPSPPDIPGVDELGLTALS